MKRNDAAPLEPKIRDWLDTQGYPLEMRVARAFQEGAFFRVIQSEYFKDSVTGHYRETDLVAFADIETGGLFIRVSFVVECKSSRDKPWILFTSNTQLHDIASVAQRVTTQGGFTLLRALAKQRAVQTLPIFSVPGRATYAVTQAFTSGKDVCYEAMSAVADGAAALVADTEEAIRLMWNAPPSKKRPVAMIEIVFPVVVTDARLFAVHLEEDSEVSVQECASNVLLWRKPVRVGAGGHTIIHIVSIGALPQFCIKARDSVSTLSAMFETELKLLVRGAYKKWNAKKQ